MPPKSCPSPILVTGGAGFIGAHLVRELLEAGARVRVLDDLSSGRAENLPLDHERLTFRQVDLRDPEAWFAGAPSESERIVHMAAVVGVQRVLADPEGCWNAHLAMAAAGEAFARAAGHRGLVHLSTSEVYRPSRQPLNEDAAVWSEGDAGWGQGRWAYACSKREVERRWTAVFGDAVSHVRLFNVVGPGQSARSGMVLPRFVEAVRAGGEPPIHGDGSQVRTFGHVRAVARDLADWVLRDQRPGGALNLGGTAVTTVRDLAKLVLAQAGRSTQGPLPAVSGAPLEEVAYRVPDLDRARAEGLIARPWDLEAIVADAWHHHPRPTSDSRSHAHSPHPHAPQPGRPGAAGACQ
ncbi:MAG: NAD-dependent epimerase/dehydratase family protein [Planctomycetota bacterium]